jgi:hypothetical protein
MKNIALGLSPLRRIRRIVLGVALFAVGSVEMGCYPKAGGAPEALSPGGVAAASTRWPGVTADSLARGRELFLAHCNACHSYPDLVVISDDRWPGLIDWMGKKAHLSDEERDAVLHFVLASRSEQGAR